MHQSQWTVGCHQCLHMLSIFLTLEHGRTFTLEHGWPDLSLSSLDSVSAWNFENLSKTHERLVALSPYADLVILRVSVGDFPNLKQNLVFIRYSPPLFFPFYQWQWRTHTVYGNERYQIGRTRKWMEPFDMRGWMLLISHPAGFAEIAPSVFFF